MAEAGPSTWPDWTDDDAWALGPDADDKRAPAEFEPGYPDPAEAAGPRLTLVEAVEAEAGAFRARGDELGRFLARQLDRLALSIAYTQANNPADFEDRLEQLEADAREQWHRDGFEDGRRSCPCRGIDD